MANPRRANGTRRNRLIKRIKREESVCHLCGCWVDVRLPHGLPGSPEVDELVPVVYGGDPLDRSNCRLAHRWCNRKRWHRPVEPARTELHLDPPHFGPDGQLIDQRPTPVTSRAW